MNLTILLAIVVAFGLTYYLIPLLKKLAFEKKLYDEPDDRKKHSSPTPALGGIAIFVGIFSATMLFIPSDEISELNFLMIGILLIVLLGIYDDLLQMEAKKKIIIQFMITSLLFFGGFRIGYLEGIPGLEQMSVGLSFLVTSIVLMLVINAYNLIDGVDGLAGSMGLLGSVLFAGLFYLAGMESWCLLALVTAASILAFLKFNFYKASIFMGDAGSTLIGLLIAIFGIQYINCCGEGAVFNADKLLLVSGIMVIPVFDLVRVATARMVKGSSPFQADRTHMHHVMSRIGLSTPAICISLVLLNLAMMYCAVWLSRIPVIIAIPALGILTGEILFLFNVVIILQKQIRKKGGLISWYSDYRNIRDNL